MCGYKLCTCRGHRTTWSVSPCLLLCLRRGFMSCTCVCTRLAPLQTFQASPVSVSNFIIGTWGLQMYITKFSLICVLGVQTRVPIIAQQLISIPSNPGLIIFKDTVQVIYLLVHNPSFLKENANVRSRGICIVHSSLWLKPSTQSNRINTSNAINELISLCNIYNLSQSSYLPCLCFYKGRLLLWFTYL